MNTILKSEYFPNDIDPSVVIPYPRVPINREFWKQMQLDIVGWNKELSMKSANRWALRHGDQCQIVPALDEKNLLQSEVIRSIIDDCNKDENDSDFIVHWFKRMFFFVAKKNFSFNVIY